MIKNVFVLVSKKYKVISIKFMVKERSTLLLIEVYIYIFIIIISV